MRAIEPRRSEQITIEDFGIGYEEFGPADAPAVLLLPAWQIVHSRIWKMQVPFLARFFRVVTFDSPGNGGGERTINPRAFEYERIARQAIGLLDYLGVERANVIGFSRGCDYGLYLAATWPERVERLMLIANGVTRAGWQPRPNPAFHQELGAYDGWQKRNAWHWRRHYDDWLAFFFQQLFSEPHSTKPIEDAIGWGRETTPEILIQTVPNPDLLPSLPIAEALARIRCPVLLLHGDDDRCEPIEASQDLIAARPDWELATLAGCGHVPTVRHPVRTNLLIHEFLTSQPVRA
jgi:pimeloyl-ACP methyl ester carboxylesterase